MPSGPFDVLVSLLRPELANQAGVSAFPSMLLFLRSFEGNLSGRQAGDPSVKNSKSTLN